MTITRRHSQYVTVEVEVDIADYLREASTDDLRELGLHVIDGCDLEEGANEQMYAAINALHQQAHPDQPLFADACLREPCRSLPLRQHPHLSASPSPY